MVITSASGQSLATVADWTWVMPLHPARDRGRVHPDQRGARLDPRRPEHLGPGHHGTRCRGRAPGGHGVDGTVRTTSRLEPSSAPRPPRRRWRPPRLRTGPPSTARGGAGQRRRPPGCRNPATRSRSVPGPSGVTGDRAAQRRSWARAVVTSPAPMVRTRSPGLARPATMSGRRGGVRHRTAPAAGHGVGDDLPGDPGLRVLAGPVDVEDERLVGQPEGGPELARRRSGSGCTGAAGTRRSPARQPGHVPAAVRSAASSVGWCA